MKSFYTKLNPFVGAGILGVGTPVAVYLIGFLAMLVWGIIAILLFPFYYGGYLDAEAFGNVTVIVSTVLQVLAVVIFTLVLSVFADLKIYHLLISAVVSSLLFFIVERFLPMVSFANIPWQWWLFPRLFAKWYYLDDKQFVEMRIYLATTLMLSAAYLLIVLITWVIYQISARKKRNKDGA